MQKLSIKKLYFALAIEIRFSIKIDFFADTEKRKEEKILKQFRKRKLAAVSKKQISIVLYFFGSSCCRWCFWWLRYFFLQAIYFYFAWNFLTQNLSNLIEQYNGAISSSIFSLYSIWFQRFYDNDGNLISSINMTNMMCVIEKIT